MPFMGRWWPRTIAGRCEPESRFLKQNWLSLSAAEGYGKSPRELSSRVSVNWGGMVLARYCGRVLEEQPVVRLAFSPALFWRAFFLEGALQKLVEIDLAEHYLALLLSRWS